MTKTMSYFPSLFLFLFLFVFAVDWLIQYLIQRKKEGRPMKYGFRHYTRRKYNVIMSYWRGWLLSNSMLKRVWEYGYTKDAHEHADEGLETKRSLSTSTSTSPSPSPSPTLAITLTSHPHLTLTSPPHPHARAQLSPCATFGIPRVYKHKIIIGKSYHWKWYLS
jgi:hypothetical protein